MVWVFLGFSHIMCDISSTSLKRLQIRHKIWRDSGFTRSRSRNKCYACHKELSQKKNIDYQGWCLSNINFSIIYPIFPKSFGEEFEINEVLHRYSKRWVFLVYQRSICSLQSRLDSSSFIPPLPETQMKRSNLLLVKILINLSPLFSSTTLPSPFI